MSINAVQVKQLSDGVLELFNFERLMSDLILIF